MRALTSLPHAPLASITEVPEPQPTHTQAIVAVRAISLNRGESRRLETMEAGSVTGWDLAGVVEQAAADGSGPREGERVVGLMRSGAWVERAAVETEWLATLPDAVSFEQAATLPVAGLTALRALEHGGFLVGKRVLVTGASGGVGRFAIQLARLAGAHVTGLARRTGGLDALGCIETISDLADASGEFDMVVEGVGGDVLGHALERVRAGGTIVNFASTLTETTYRTREFFSRASGARLIGLFIFAELSHTRSGGTDLRRLADLVAAGHLDTQIARTDSWHDAGDAIAALLDRKVDGKAVLLVD